MLSIVSAVLSLAKRYKWIDENLAELAALPSPGDHEPDPPTSEQAAALLNLAFAADEVAAPFLQDLYAGTMATIHLAIRDAARVLYLERLSGQRSVPVVSRTGSRLALHATGVGKVLLAYAPPDVQHKVLSPLRRITPYTITQPARLRAQLDRVLADGYATTADEMTLGACSVAVPIRRGDDVVAALGIVVPSLRRDKGRLVSALTVAAHGIGRSLGPHPAPGEKGRPVRDH